MMIRLDFSKSIMLHCSLLIMPEGSKMQVKPVSNKLQIYVSAYVPEKKRSVQVMAGSLDRYSLPKIVPDDLAKGMHDALAKIVPDDQAKAKADDEAAALQDWLDDQHAAAEEDRRSRAATTAVRSIAGAADLLEFGELPTVEQCDEIDEQIRRIRKVMRRARRHSSKQ